MRESQIKRFISVLLLAILLVSFFPQKTRAQFIVEDPMVAANTLATSVQVGALAGLQVADTTWHTVTKNGLDFLVYQASQVLMNIVTENIINWIRGGFNGSPTFAIDPQRFFNDLADVVAGDLANYIRGIAVCDFDANFRISLMNSLFLTQEYDTKYKRQIVCPFDAIDYTTCDKNGQNCRRQSPAEQAQAFAQNFVNGGWNAYEATLRDGGNKFGVALVTQRELQRRTIQHQKIQEQKLTQSGGFLDILNTESCTYPEGTDLSLMSGREKQAYQRLYCKTSTPGAIVSSQLSKVTGIDLDRLGFADNLNKIASAFIQQVAKMAIEGVYTPRADGGNGLTRARAESSDYNYYGSCAARGESVAPTPEQSNQITAAAFASPTVQDLQRRFNDALTASNNASDTAQTIRDEIRRATDAYNAGVSAANTIYTDRYLPLKQTYDACVARYSTSPFVDINEVCTSERTNMNNAFTDYNIAKSKINPPSGELWLAKERSDDGLVEAEAEERRTASILNSTRNDLNSAVDTAYRNATMAVIGTDVVAAGTSCVSENVNSVSQDITTQGQNMSLDELYQAAREAEPQAI